MKKTIVLSLGGSVIIPDKPNYIFLNKFKKELRKSYKKNKFVVVCGGGEVARKYIRNLKNKSNKEKSLAGIRATRMNAKFMMQFFGKEANDTLPLTMKSVSSNLKKNNIVFCGALRYSPDSTSDGTAAKLSEYLKTIFINVTNIKGLYSSNPKTNKKSRFIPKISWKKFRNMAKRKKHKPGQHFVLDQKAAELIEKKRIKTYIVGPSPSNIIKIIENKKFIGTTISG